MSRVVGNPFSVKMTEWLTPEEVAQTFVPFSSTAANIGAIGHAFIHGARGTGKSIALRSLEPAVHLAGSRKGVDSIKDCAYFAVHIPMRLFAAGGMEVPVLKDSSKYILGEHLLVMYSLSYLFSVLTKLFDREPNLSPEISTFIEGYLKALGDVGWAGSLGEGEQYNFETAQKICKKEHSRALQYAKRLVFSAAPIPYQGALAGYLDFIVPLARKLKKLSFVPNAPLYLMIDDADTLTVELQRILNTWVATRSQTDVSLKITTQNRYKTWRTIDGSLIASPHDFSEIDFGTIYTSHKGDDYKQRAHEIIRNRLKMAGIDATPEEFFPPDPKQKIAIEAEKQRLKNEFDATGRGYRASDDVTRYAVPNYMASLAGKSKSSATFRYAGFDTLVNLSSGVIRWLLEPASFMVNDVMAQSGEHSCPMFIPPGVQDERLKKWSVEFWEQELGRIENVGSDIQGEAPSDDDVDLVKRLKNLVEALGSTFRGRLLDSDASERKVFSILVTGQVREPVRRVLALGVETGILQTATKGSKEGLGVRAQYILSRRLAPMFKLDPSSYAAYLSVDPIALEVAIRDPKKFISKRLGKSEGFTVRQLDLDF